MRLSSASARRVVRVRRGFTLMEAAVVTVVVGVGVVAMVELLAAGTMANGQSTRLTTAIGLASNIREMSLRVEYKDVMTLDNKVHSPPVDSRGVALSGMEGWQQTVSVDYVDPNRITVAVPKTQTEPTARITVTVSRHGHNVYTSHWLTTASEWP